MADQIRVNTRSIQDLRRWIITQGQFSPCGTELLECLMHIDCLKASQPSAMNLEQTTFGIAEALPPSDQEIEEWADQSDLIPDEELVCDEQWQRCFLPEQFYATIRAALARWGNLAGTLLRQSAPSLDADTLRKVWREAAWGGRWATLADYVALAVEAQRAPSGNPPATEGSWDDAQQTVAERSHSHIAVSLLQLAAVNARQSRWLSSALCERAAELIQPASDGDREELAKMLIADAECLEAEQPDLMAMTNHQMRRAATLLRQPAPAVVPVAVAERPWEREGWCDAEGGCWWSHGPTLTAGWSLLPMDGMDDARGWLLPHWAIPIPQPPHSAEMQP